MSTKVTDAGFEQGWNNFWFAPVSAAGFGMMRIVWAATAFMTMLLELQNVERFYGPDGILPREMVANVMRSAWRFSLLDFANGTATWVLYFALLAALALVVLGIWTRFSLIVSIVLLYSFHEYGSITLDGGDTLMRLIGFILVISPCNRAMTLSNLRKRMRLTRDTGKDQNPLERTMPVWPYRLLLWQMILLYVASAIEKWSGSTWHTGSAVSIVLHHGQFTRLPTEFADSLAIASPMMGYFTLVSQFAWILLLIIPVGIWLNLCHESLNNSLKRALLLCGIVLHGGILLSMDVGTFSLSVFAAYFGLLLDDDFRAIRRYLNKRITKPAVVLFDGRCGFCKKAILLLSMLDWLHRLEFKNYHDSAVRTEYAPDTPFEVLDKAMHVRLPNGDLKKGFSAFRSLTWHLPLLWIFAPFLFVPGVSKIGDAAYNYIATHRPKI